ncbi:hypothetical protein EJD97_006983 [Solanum chilense]|uniref:Chromo domain-containing protein n=1 Tax=Solanum chilense TaxID=4083 RepID=A0A6N2BSV6_SOLCI|nr:hypothetical protein EJD97_006983 [Solanum chilense]
MEGEQVLLKVSPMKGVVRFGKRVRKLRSREIAFIKVQWKNRPVEQSTWEKEVDMQERYAHLFTDSGTLFRHCFSSSDCSRTNDRLSQRIPRRTVMGTTDRRGCLVPKKLEF